MKNLNWNKEHTQLWISSDEKYAIVGRYTYYQGWQPFYLPNGKRGNWISLDGQYAGKGALETCKLICDEHTA
jgi:hypothetical protein